MNFNSRFWEFRTLNIPMREREEDISLDSVPTKLEFLAPMLMEKTRLVFAERHLRVSSLGFFSVVYEIFEAAGL